jgi:hypothetical protein
VEEIYDAASEGQSSTLRIAGDTPPASPDRTRPVIYPPKVLAIYVPEHLDRERDLKIGAHWIYCKLRDSSWVEEPIDREPATAEAVTAEDATRLRDLLPATALARMIVPYRASSDDDARRGNTPDREEEERR